MNNITPCLPACLIYPIILQLRLSPKKFFAFSSFLSPNLECFPISHTYITPSLSLSLSLSNNLFPNVLLAFVFIFRNLYYPPPLALSKSPANDHHHQRNRNPLIEKRACEKRREMTASCCRLWSFCYFVWKKNKKDGRMRREGEI